MNHTKEPWHSGEQDFTGVDILCADELQIASVEIEEDARRIVACVNACAGISTESMEVGGVGSILSLGLEEQRRGDIAEKRRDELLAALRQIALMPCASMRARKMSKVACEAIDSVKSTA